MTGMCRREELRGKNLDACSFRKREREEKEELVEKAKKEKEWKQEWDVSMPLASVFILLKFSQPGTIVSDLSV